MATVDGDVLVMDKPRVESQNDMKQTTEAEYVLFLKLRCFSLQSKAGPPSEGGRGGQIAPRASGFSASWHSMLRGLGAS